MSGAGTCGSCGQVLPPMGQVVHADLARTHAALVEYESALVDWSETHRAAIWDSKHQPEHAAACKRLRAATAAVRALAREAVAVEPEGGPCACQDPLPRSCRDWWWEIDIDFCWSRDLWSIDTCDGPLPEACVRPALGVAT